MSTKLKKLDRFSYSVIFQSQLFTNDVQEVTKLYNVPK